MSGELYDVEVERNILKALIQDKEYLRVSVLYGRILPEHFVDLFHIDSFKTIVSYYKKFGAIPTIDRFKNHLKKYITYHKKYKTRVSQKKIWQKASERLFISLDQMTIENRDADESNLEELRKARLIQNTIMIATEEFEEGNIDHAFTTMAGAVLKSKHTETVVTEGDIVTDYDSNLNYIEQRQAGIIKPIRTLLPIIFDYKANIDSGEKSDSEMEGFESFKISSLDEILDGGFYDGDLSLIVGETNVGKSMALMNFCYNISRLGEKNVVLFTIEMSKMKQQFRIYSRMTGIPYSKFRKGELDNKDIEHWEKCLAEWEKKAGMLYVVAFDQGATVEDVKEKMTDIQNRLGKSIDFVAIDYLNDMTPSGRYQTDRSWDAMGSISWELSQLCKYWNNHKGIPILTANQKKDSSKTLIDWGDIGYGKIVGQHCSVGIGLAMSDEDRGFKRLQMNIWKNRDGEKGQVFYVYPDFSKAKLSSYLKMAEYYDFDIEEG